MQKFDGVRRLCRRFLARRSRAPRGLKAVAEPPHSIRAAVIALIASTLSAVAQDAPQQRDRPVYRVERLADTIRVDGRLDESAYTAPPTFELAYETRPAENTQAPARTEVWITYDSANLYVAFRAHDPDPKQTARATPIATTLSTTTSSASPSTPSTTSAAPSSSSPTPSACRWTSPTTR